MSFSEPGIKRGYVAVREVRTNHFCVVNRHVLLATRIRIPSRFEDPSDTAAVETILVGEQFTGELGGVHEVDRAGNLNAAVAGDRVWIDPDDDVLKLTPAAGDLPVGIVDSIDTVRDKCKVNCNALNAFMASA